MSRSVVLLETAPAAAAAAAAPSSLEAAAPPAPPRFMLVLPAFPVGDVPGRSASKESERPPHAAVPAINSQLSTPRRFIVIQSPPYNVRCGQSRKKRYRWLLNR